MFACGALLRFYGKYDIVTSRRSVCGAVFQGLFYFGPHPKRGHILEREQGQTPLTQRTPEQTPQKTEKRFFTKRESIIMGVSFVLVLILVVCGVLMMLSASRTAPQAVNRAVEEDLRVQESVIQLSLLGDDTRSVLFYISADEMACAILKRGAAGYKLVDAGGHLPLTSEDKLGIWKTLGSGKKEIFVFGMLYSPTVQNVLVDGMPAVIVNTGQYRCWYYYAAGSTSINSESVVYQ